MDLRWDGLNKIGNWKSKGDYRVNFTKIEPPSNENDKDYGPISNKTFRVIIALVYTKKTQMIMTKNDYTN